MSWRQAARGFFSAPGRRAPRRRWFKISEDVYLLTATRPRLLTPAEVAALDEPRRAARRISLGTLTAEQRRARAQNAARARWGTRT